jgi:hypothetical protein
MNVEAKTRATLSYIDYQQFGQQKSQIPASRREKVLSAVTALIEV